MFLNNFINHKITPLIFNKFFFLKRSLKFNNLFLNISNFKDNDILFVSAFIEDIVCLKPILKDSGFNYDNLGNKIYNSYIQLTISNCDFILNFIFYFYILSKNLKLRRTFFKKLSFNSFYGIFSTFDISFYLFRDIFSFVAFSFIFNISILKENNNRFKNLLISFHFFKNLGLY